MPGIAEISSELDTAIREIEESKAKLDTAQKEYQFATNAHTDAINKAIELRAKLDAELNKLMPSNNPGRIRGAA